MNNLLLLVFPALLALSTMYPSQDGPKFEAELETSLHNNMLTVQSLFKNNSQENVHFTYRFISERKGKAGTSSNSQSGSAKAAAGQEIRLSQTAFSVSSQDTYVIQLEILDGDKVVAEDSLVYPN